MADLGATAAVLLVASLATERWVAVARTAFPTLSREPHRVAGETDPVDRPRRLVLQGVALAGAWLVAALLAGRGMPGARAFVGVVRAGTVELPVPVVAILACGGSAFWSQAMQLARSAKELTATRLASERLTLRARAESLGLPHVDSGVAAGRGTCGDRRVRLRMQLDAQPPRRLNAPARGAR